MHLHVFYVKITPGGGGTPLYGLYRYVRQGMVFSHFGHK